MRGWGVLAAALGAVVASGAGAAGAAEPTFVNGLAQNVFSTNTADWIRGEGWVQSTYDSDHDGKLDRIHFDITRPKETASGLKVPVILEASPYYANLGPNSNWSVDVEIGAHAAGAAVPAELHHPQHEPEDRDDVRGGVAAARLRGHARREPRHRPLRRLPDRRRAERERRDEGRRRLDQRPRAGVHAPAPGTTPIVADWATGKVGMMGTSYNGSLPIAAAATGVAGLEAIVPISPVSDYYEYYRANGMVRGPGGWQGEDADVLVDVVYTRQDETYPRMICRAADRADRPRRGPRHRQPQRVLGRAQPQRAGRRTCTPPCCSRTATTTTT